MSVQEQNWWWRRISREVEKLKAKAKAKARVGRVGRVEGGKNECRSCLFSGARRANGGWEGGGGKG